MPSSTDPLSSPVLTTDFLCQLHQQFDALPDPRVKRTRLHPLKDILLIAVVAVLCLADGFEPMARWAKAKGVDWLRDHLGVSLPHGVPHHDTFRRVLSRLPPQFIEATLHHLLDQLPLAIDNGVRPTGPKHIALDGKETKGSFDAQSGTPSLHLLHAFATEERLLLACQQVEAKSNEIPAAPQLLKHLPLAGAVVTADAMHCQRETAAAVVAGKGDYVLAVKDNQPRLHAALEHLFEHCEPSDPKCPKRVPVLPVPVQEHCYHEKNRGRIEQRRCRRVLVNDWLPANDPLRELWPQLTSVLCLERTRHWMRRGEPKQSQSRLFFISSRDDSAARHQDWIRGHWEIENSLHLVLDVTFGDDRCRARKDFAPANLALLRRLVLNWVRLTPSTTTATATSLIGKRQQAAWSDEYLRFLLRGTKAQET